MTCPISRSSVTMAECMKSLKYNMAKISDFRKESIRRERGNAHEHIDYVYSTTNNSDSHYILESVVKKIKLKDTGFPQLTAEDVIKHKVLMEYGTPKEYDGVWHNYGDENSIFRVRKLDERNVKVEVDGLQIADKLNKAIEDVYSQQGIEYKKRLMMDGIDL